MFLWWQLFLIVFYFVFFNFGYEQFVKDWVYEKVCWFDMDVCECGFGILYLWFNLFV